MTSMRGLTAAQSKHVSKIRDYLVEAQRHHSAAVDAHDKSDHAAVSRAHNSLGRCLDGAERACRGLAAELMAEDTANSQSAQTSAGITNGTSGDGRLSHPLFHGDIAGWLSRTFPRGARH